MHLIQIEILLLKALLTVTWKRVLYKKKRTYNIPKDHIPFTIRCCQLQNVVILVNNQLSFNLSDSANKDLHCWGYINF